MEFLFSFFVKPTVISDENNRNSSPAYVIIRIDNYYMSFMSQEIDQEKHDIHVMIASCSVNLSRYNRGYATFRYYEILDQLRAVYCLSLVIRFIRM